MLPLSRYCASSIEIRGRRTAGALPSAHFARVNCPGHRQTNSTTTRRPTKAAARCKLDSVMSRFGSRMRSTCDRLVFSKTAMRALEIFRFFMATANCEATTSLTERARTFPEMFSLFKKSATLDRTLFLRILIVILARRSWRGNAALNVPSMHHRKYTKRLSSLL